MSTTYDSTKTTMRLVAFLAVLPGCFPPGFEDGTESFAGTETGITGDGDPGDGDGDPGCGMETPSIACSDGECWASAPSWTAEARATVVDHVIEPGIWVPVNLGVGTECWELDGVGTHVCIVEVCGERLLGTPADEMALEPPGPECGFIGVWDSTGAVGGQCFGIVDGVAVELRSDGGCFAPLPVGWGEELADAWIHSCNVAGTFVECCAAVRTEVGHLSEVSAIAGGEAHEWASAPLFADAGTLESVWISTGSTRFEWVSWDYCGLPLDVGDPTTRTFELRITDYELGVTASDSVTMAGSGIQCHPNGWCCTSLAPDEVCFYADVPGQCEAGSWCPSDVNGNPDCA